MEIILSNASLTRSTLRNELSFVSATGYLIAQVLEFLLKCEIFYTSHVQKTTVSCSSFLSPFRLEDFDAISFPARARAISLSADFFFASLSILS